MPVINDFTGAVKVAQIAKKRWLANNTQDQTSRGVGLAAAQTGLSMIGGVTSLIQGIKGKTSKNNVKYTFAIRNLTPFMIVFNSCANAYKGEGVYPIIKPDETTEWVFTQDKTTDNQSGRDIGPSIGLSIVTDATDSNADEHTLYLQIKDQEQISNNSEKTVRLHDVSWNAGQNYGSTSTWETNTKTDSDRQYLHAVYYTAPASSFPGTLMVTAMPLGERDEELRLEITIVCQPGYTV